MGVELCLVLKCLADSQDFSYIRCVDRVPSFEAAWVARNARRLSLMCKMCCERKCQSMLHDVVVLIWDA